MMKKITVKKFKKAMAGKTWRHMDKDTPGIVGIMDGDKIHMSYMLENTDQILVDTDTGVYILDYGECGASVFEEANVEKSNLRRYIRMKEYMTDEELENVEKLSKVREKVMMGMTIKQAYEEVGIEIPSNNDSELKSFIGVPVHKQCELARTWTKSIASDEQIKLELMSKTDAEWCLWSEIMDKILSVSNLSLDKGRIIFQIGTVNNIDPATLFVAYMDWKNKNKETAN